MQCVSSFGWSYPNNYGVYWEIEKDDQKFLSAQGILEMCDWASRHFRHARQFLSGIYLCVTSSKMDPRFLPAGMPEGYAFSPSVRSMEDGTD